MYSYQNESSYHHGQYVFGKDDGDDSSSEEVQDHRKTCGGDQFTEGHPVHRGGASDPR